MHFYGIISQEYITVTIKNKQIVAKFEHKNKLLVDFVTQMDPN